MHAAVTAGAMQKYTRLHVATQTLVNHYNYRMNFIIVASAVSYVFHCHTEQTKSTTIKMTEIILVLTFLTLYDRPNDKSIYRQ